MTSRVVIPVLENLEQNDKPLVKQVVKGIKQIQEQQIASQTNTTNQTSFNFQPPSQNTVIDRCFVLEQSWQVTATANNAFVYNTNNKAGIEPNLANAGNITTAPTLGAANQQQTIGFRRSTQYVPAILLGDGTNNRALSVNSFTAGQAVSFENNFAPRQFPLANCMDSIDLVINGTHFTVSCNDYIQAIMRYTTPEWREQNLGYTYHAPDLGKQYGSKLKEAGTDWFTELSTGDYNPLNVPQDGFRAGETPRGSVFSRYGVTLNKSNSPEFSVNANGNVMTVTMREPLFISPLMAMCGHGLTNVNQLDITIRWNSNLASRLFSFQNVATNQLPTNNDANSGSSFATTVADFATVAIPANYNALLHMRYYTPQDDVNIPNEIVLPYKQPQVQIQSLAAAAGTVTLNNVRLNQVPESCYIYIKRDKSNAQMNFMDNYAIINNINVNWKNQTGILSGFSESDLANLAQYNGYDCSLYEQGSAGTVLKLNFGQDLPLDDNESPGTRGDYNWQLTISYDAGNTDGGALKVYQVFVLNGHAIVSPNECRVSTGVLSLEDNMNAEEMGHTYNAGTMSVAGGSAVGGSLVGGSEVGGSLIGGTVGHLKKVYNIGKHLYKAGQAAAPELGEAVKAYHSRA